MLAHASTELQERVLSGEVQVGSGEPLVESVTLRRTLAHVRRTGLAVINRGRPAPVVSVAAPVRGEQDLVLAALSIVVPAGGANPNTLEPAVRAAARAVSRGLGSPTAMIMRPGS